MRTILAESDFLAREALAGVLRRDPGTELVAVCRDAGELRAELRKGHIDVVVTAMRLQPSMECEGLAIASELRRHDPRTGVLVLGDEADAQEALGLLAGGADGRAFLVREHVRDPHQLMSAVLAVARGGSIVDAKVVQSVASSHAARHESPLAELRPCEHDILVEMASGASNEAIARSQHMTKRVVEKHVSAIFAKLEVPSAPGVSRRVRAVLMYLDATREPVRQAPGQPRRETAAQP